MTYRLTARRAEPSLTELRARFDGTYRQMAAARAVLAAAEPHGEYGAFFASSARESLAELEETEVELIELAAGLGYSPEDFE